ncbi:hypothetical protein DHW03_15005 [Pedobacter yonginense]|uniref:Membrane fusion protein biotin-lipoyl like domain-containing protein n=1 Tax=Pedobacter yonginense TaxID=651869 RepID=A0A317EI71_9SPHI|nr:HlyD family efflux transporter periplasmic adaptor subunit [Pedobacter yonginense]PWS26105.1 hypothetical protein DHW03_15005 [Pedobacter yonginense]
MPEKRDNEDVNEVSEEINEIIGKIPNRVFARTTYFVLVILILFLISAYFIQYPQKMSGDITVFNSSRPLKIICQENGQIAKIFVRDGEYVNAGEPLALIDNATSHESVVYLKKMSSNYSYVFKNIDAIIANDNIPLSFGEMQSEYNALINNLVSFKELTNPINKIKLNNLYSIKKRNDSINKILRLHSIANLNEFSKESQRLKDYTKLFESGVISKHEYYNAVANQFSSRTQVDNNDKEIVQQNLGTLRAIQDVNDYIHHLSTEKERLYHEIYANIRNIEVFIRNWDQKYVIKALKSGKISFLNLINEGQYFRTGDELLAILTPNQGIVGIANISIEGAGNIEIGQRARVNLKKYPYYEYGFLEGSVGKISVVTNNNLYKLTIAIESVELKKLEEKLKDEQEAVGEVEIITKEYTLFDRLFMNIYQTFEK